MSTPSRSRNAYSARRFRRRDRDPRPTRCSGASAARRRRCEARPSRERLAHVVGREQRGAARARVGERRRRGRGEIRARGHVDHRVVDQHGVERAPEPQRAHVAGQVLALRVQRAATAPASRARCRSACSGSCCLTKNALPPAPAPSSSSVPPRGAPRARARRRRRPPRPRDRRRDRAAGTRASAPRTGAVACARRLAHRPVIGSAPCLPDTTSDPGARG